MSRLIDGISSTGKPHYTNQLTLGGNNDESGIMEVLDERGDINVKLDKNGILLGTGRKIVGGQGLLTNLQIPSNIISRTFLGASALLPMGYSGGGGSYYFKDSLQFDFIIPTGFTIESAYVIINHIPVKYYELGVLKYTGYSRNLELYKNTGITTGYMNYDYQYFEVSTDNYGTWTKIDNAFGASGFTGSNTGYTSLASIDIKASIVTGFNSLRIQTRNALVTTDKDMYENNGACNGVLYITGYTKS